MKVLKWLKIKKHRFEARITADVFGWLIIIGICSLYIFGFAVLIFLMPFL